MKRLLLFLLLLTIAIPVSTFAGDTSTSTPAIAASTNTTSNTIKQANNGPVTVPKATPKAMRYYNSGNLLWIFDTIWGLLIPLLFLFTGFSAYLRDIAKRIGKRWYWIIVIYFLLFALINYIIDFPVSYYEGFVREHIYGLSNQSFHKWFIDGIKTLTIALVGGTLLLWIPFYLLKKSPKRWWLYSGLLSIPFSFLALMVIPVFIAPMFNHFGPMKDKALEAKILKQAARAGITGSKVYEVDKSADTKSINAYVSGMGSTKRIVLWDNAIKELNQRELLFVMGHEMGHYVLDHVIYSVFFNSAMIILMFYLVHLTSGWMIRKYKHKFRFDSLSDVAALPLLIFLFTFFSFIFSPISLAYSRHHEHEADRFGLEITKDNHAAATAFVKLMDQNLANPNPGFLYVLFRSSHPPLSERIHFCNTYKPWSNGGKMKYAHLFKNK